MGWTKPNQRGRRYRHGTTTAYGMAKCRCRHCRDAVAAYRAGRRAAGKDQPRTPRTVDTDGHIGRGWFRRAIWLPALTKADVGIHVTPHGLRHAHASWLLAGGADLQVVKERLGHASITTTEKYLHTLPNADMAALEAMDRMRAPAQAPSGTTGGKMNALRAATGALDTVPSGGLDLESAIQTMDVETVRLLLACLVQRAQATNDGASP